MFILTACAEEVVVKESDPGEATIVDGSDALYDPSVLHEFALTIDQAAWDELRTQTRTYYDLLGEGCMEGPWESPYTWFEAELSVDGVAVGTIGVRKKGLLGSLSTTRPSLRIDTDHYVDDLRYLGLEKMVLNNQNQDPSRLQTCLAHAWFDDAGLVAPRCSLAHVTVNGEDLGVYDNTEAIDEDLVVRDRGGAPTSMYEGALSDFREPYIRSFEAETDDSDGSDLTAVMTALEQPDDSVMAALDTVLDLDAFFTFWAAESMAGHWDGYNANTNNFYVYGAPEDGRLEFIASGPDATFDSEEPFGNGEPVWVATRSALSNRLIQIPEAKSRYEARLTELLDRAWDTDEMLARIDRWAELVKPVDDKTQRDAIEELRGVVSRKEAALRAAVGEDVSPWALSGDPCWTSIGSVTVDFSTTWGSYPDGDVLSGGEAVTSYVIEGTEYVATDDGVTAGDEGTGNALWLTISTLSPNVYVAPYLSFDPSLLTDGATFPIDGSVAQSVLYYNSPDTGGQWTTAAWLGEGTMHFDTASAVAGAPITGRFEVAVLGSGG